MTLPSAARACALLIVGFALAAACRRAPPKAAEPAALPDQFDEYMEAGIPPADGFDFPVGDADAKGSYTDRATGRVHQGWYVATKFGEEYSLGIHPAEDWNGRGGGDTDLGQDVRAVAAGRVVTSAQLGQPWGNVIVVEHVYYENNRKLRLRSLYAHLLKRLVREGELVARRQLIGAIGKDPDATFSAHLHLELRRDFSLPPTYWPSSNGKDQAWVRAHYEPPTAFIRAHRALPLPQREPALALVSASARKLRLYQRGKSVGTYEVAFGQAEGQKRRRDDLKSPRGMYYVIDKVHGQISGDYGAYYGGIWIKLNYPNAFDAAWGREHGLLDKTREEQVAGLWRERRPTPQDTALGSGIGFHAWIKEWPDEGPRRLSWGCVVLHVRDAERVFAALPAGAMVVLL